MAEDSQLAEATQALSFAEFLERMKEPAAADLVRSIKNFIRTFDDRAPDPERDSAAVQAFLANSEGAFRNHPVWASAPPVHQSQALEGLEKYLMTKIYHKAFAVSALDRERDEALALRCTALGFIRPHHLDIPELYQDDKAWVLAMKELHKINNYKAPRDKLVCILNCCRVINNLLHVASQHGEARGADDFLPVLIYVVVHANPPQLASNLEYIQRFRMQSRMASESAYFFTQLYSAASFIETINSSSLSMDPDEFVARMVAAGVADMQLMPSPAAANSGAAAPPAPLLPASPLATSSAGLPGPLPAARESLPTAGAVPGPGAGRSLGAPPVTLAAQGVAVESSVEALEREGVGLVLAEEAAGHLHARPRFLYASVPDLRMADVAALLAQYKDTALRYEALSLAVRRRGTVGLTPLNPAVLEPASVQALAAAPSPARSAVLGQPAVSPASVALSPGKDAALLGTDLAAAVSAAPAVQAERLPSQLPEDLGGTAAPAASGAGSHLADDDRVLSLKPSEVEDTAVEVVGAQPAPSCPWPNRLHSKQSLAALATADHTAAAPPQASEAPAPQPSAADPYAAFMAGPLAKLGSGPNSAEHGPQPPLSGFAEPAPAVTPLQPPASGFVGGSGGRESAAPDAGEDPYAMWRMGDLVSSLSRHAGEGGGAEAPPTPEEPTAAGEANEDQDDPDDPYRAWRSDALVKAISATRVSSDQTPAGHTVTEEDAEDTDAPPGKEAQPEEPDASYDPYAMWRKTDLVSRLSSSAPHTDSNERATTNGASKASKAPERHPNGSPSSSKAADGGEAPPGTDLFAGLTTTGPQDNGSSAAAEGQSLL